MKLTDKQAVIFELVKSGATIIHYLTPNGHVRSAHEVVVNGRSIKKTSGSTLTKLLAMDLIELHTAERGVNSLTSTYKLKENKS